jgi:FkbM family methyltransferase
MFDEYEVEIVNRFVRDLDVVFDVGAHIGLWSRLCLNKYKGLRLHAFEPMPNAFAQMQANLYMYRTNNEINLINKALSDHINEAVPFYCLTTTNMADSMGSTFHPDRFPPGHLEQYQPEWISVDTTTVDSYCEAFSIPEIDFMKVDVEYHQMEVFKGSHRMLAKQRIKAIVWESVNAYVKEETDFLSRFGYYVKMVRLNPYRLDPLDLTVPYYNYLALCR